MSRVPSRLTSCLIIWLSFFASSTALAPRFVSNIFPTAAAPAAPVDEGRRSLIRSVGTAFLVALPAAAEADSSPLQELAAIGGWVDSGGKTKSGKEQVLNEDGEYVDANRGGDSGWQDTWKSRLDKASSMSADVVRCLSSFGAAKTQRVTPNVIPKRHTPSTRQENGSPLSLCAKIAFATKMMTPQGDRSD